MGSPRKVTIVTNDDWLVVQQAFLRPVEMLCGGSHWRWHTFALPVVQQNKLISICQKFPKLHSIQLEESQQLLECSMDIFIGRFHRQIDQGHGAFSNETLQFCPPR